MSNALKPQLVPSVSDQASIIDEFGELRRQEALFAPKKARLEALRKTILGWVPAELAGAQPVSFYGNTYILNLSARQNERRVSFPAKLLKFLGAAKFWALCEIGVGKLEAELGEDGASKWLVKAPTGPRTITAVLAEKAA